jgi:Putative beta-barrel porin-2, OmpL-like. bbp2
LALKTAQQSFYVILGTLLILHPVSYVIAQTVTPPTPAAPQVAAIPATPAAPASLVISAPSAAPEPGFLAKSPISVSGILDGYYDFDANHPDDGDTQLRNFDIRANTVSLTEAKIVLAHDPAPFGFRADIGFGSALDLMHPSNPSGGGLKYVEQMFVSSKPAKWKGFEADFGQFVTSAGAEIIESADNWNYSRSLLFSFAIPYYHFGVRTSMPVTSTFTAGVQVVQGWNNIFDNNSGKTVGFTAVQAKKYYTLNATYYVGPENNNTDHGYRNLLDAVLLLTPSAKFNAYLNYDYGQNRNANATNTGVGTLAHWQGIAGAAHVQATSKITATLRAEYYSDPNGFTTGTAQKLNEVTGTADYLLHAGILARAEYRYDHSNQLYFQKNGVPASVNGQSTIEVSLIAFFGPKT